MQAYIAFFSDANFEMCYLAQPVTGFQLLLADGERLLHRQCHQQRLLHFPNRLPTSDNHPLCKTLRFQCDHLDSAKLNQNCFVIFR